LIEVIGNNDYFHGSQKDYVGGGGRKEACFWAVFI
jgi:hypothetical protein